MNPRNPGVCSCFKRTLVAVLGAAALAVGLNAYAGPLEDMAAFDAAYIPALVLTNQPKREAAERAMAKLDQALIGFKQRVPEPLRADKLFAAELAQVEKCISDAARIMGSGGSLTAAHDALEPVRQILLVARRRNGLQYYPDYLTEFHDVMEDLVLAAKKGVPLDDAQRDEVSTLLARADVAWMKVETVKYDPAVYALDAERSERLKAGITAERERLDELRRLQDGGDWARWVEQAPALKSGFSRVFALFGDFNGLQ